MLARWGVLVVIAGALTGACVDLRKPGLTAGDGGPVLPQKPIGDACTLDGQCASGFCVDGLCCKTQCQGACMTCNKPGSPGFCMFADADTNARKQCKDDGCAQVPSCDGAGNCRKKNQGETCLPGSCDRFTLTLAGRCDDQGACIAGPTQNCAPFFCGADLKCRSSCGDDLECVNGSKCEKNLCGPKALGTPCEDGSECASTFCASKVCCKSTCEGPCRSCALEGSAGTCTAVPAGKAPTIAGGCANPDKATMVCGRDETCDGAGACRLAVAGSMCSPSSCANAALRPAGTCDGKGTCQVLPTVTCGGYTCDSPPTKCRTVCVTDAECASPSVCGMKDHACGGLSAQYFRQTNLTDLAFMRTDDVVDIDWGGGSPNGLLNVDNFSVRWRGKVTARFTETYNFYVGSDDGEKLWVGGTLIIDRFIRKASVPEDKSTAVKMVAGQPVDIVLEYFENGGDASVRLSWQSPSEPKAVVPTSALSPQ